MNSLIGTTLAIIMTLLILLGAALAVSYFIGNDYGAARVVTPVAEPTTAPEEGVFCTQDAQECPDGSYVGRVGPNCEFAPCP
jgi:hypothetical protein